MKSGYELPPTEERLARRRARQERERQRRKARRRRQLALLIAVPLLTLAVFLLLRGPKPQPRGEEPPAASSAVSGAVSAPEEPPVEPEPVFALAPTEGTVTLGEDFPSEFAVLADGETGEILAEKGSDQLLSPASMTKVLTLLVAAESVTDWERVFVVDRETADFCFRHDCSVVGYEVGEEVPARELLYGCILSSGADASLGLAALSAGSQEAFVERMNEKAAELGLSEGAHFTNCVGLYDPEHRCTARDMALILRSAMENELCREVLTAKRYHTAATPFHPEGQDLSNWFLRRIEDKDCGNAEVLAAKTGYVAESGSCAASYAQDAQGRGYLCVTGNAHSAWRTIYDHAEVYRSYVPCGGSSGGGKEKETGQRSLSGLLFTG